MSDLSIVVQVPTFSCAWVWGVPCGGDRSSFRGTDSDHFFIVSPQLLQLVSSGLKEQLFNFS